MNHVVPVVLYKIYIYTYKLRSSRGTTTTTKMMMHAAIKLRKWTKKNSSLQKCANICVLMAAKWLFPTFRVIWLVSRAVCMRTQQGWAQTNRNAVT